MAEVASWVNDPEDPREKLRQLIAQAFLDATGTTWLWDKGALVVEAFLAHPELVNEALAIQGT